MPRDSKTLSNAGRKGGETTAHRYGSGYYSKIGQLGGKSSSKNRERMREIGRIGGMNSRKNVSS